MDGCVTPEGPIVFTEAPGSPRIVGSPPGVVVPADTDGPSRIASLVALVGTGDIERCRDVVRVDARPRGAFVAVTTQAREDGASRFLLSVVTT